jgi:hypothetical protein
MDRNYVTHYKKVPVYEMGLMAFRDTIILGDATLKQNLIQILLDLVGQERRGIQIDTLLVRSTIQMLIELSSSSSSNSTHQMMDAGASNSTKTVVGGANSGASSSVPQSVYRECFEDAYVADAEKFYRAEARDFIMSSCPEFVLKAEQRIREERQRVQT